MVGVEAEIAIHASVDGCGREVGGDRRAGPAIEIVDIDLPVRGPRADPGAATSSTAAWCWDRPMRGAAPPTRRPASTSRCCVNGREEQSADVAAVLGDPADIVRLVAELLGAMRASRCDAGRRDHLRLADARSCGPSREIASRPTFGPLGGVAVVRSHRVPPAPLEWRRHRTKGGSSCPEPRTRKPEAPAEQAAAKHRRRRRSAAFQRQATDPVGLAQSYFSAVDARDVDGMVACWAPGGLERIAPIGEMQAPEGVRGVLQRAVRGRSGRAARGARHRSRRTTRSSCAGARPAPSAAEPSRASSRPARASSSRAWTCSRSRTA